MVMAGPFPKEGAKIRDYEKSRREGHRTARRVLLTLSIPYNTIHSRHSSFPN